MGCTGVASAVVGTPGVAVLACEAHALDVADAVGGARVRTLLDVDPLDAARRRRAGRTRAAARR